MSIAIYLSPKSAGVSTVIYIDINNHEPKGYIETSPGKVIKLNGLNGLNGDKNGKSSSKQNC